MSNNQNQIGFRPSVQQRLFLVSGQFKKLLERLRAAPADLTSWSGKFRADHRWRTGQQWDNSSSDETKAPSPGRAASWSERQFGRRLAGLPDVVSTRHGVGILRERPQHGLRDTLALLVRYPLGAVVEAEQPWSIGTGSALLPWPEGKAPHGTFPANPMRAAVQPKQPK